MEGDRRLVLHEPTPGQNVGGQIVPGTPIDHVVWAIRRDRGGGEGLQADTHVGEWNSRYELRGEGLEDIDHTWTITDEKRRKLDIEAISEVPGTRGRKLWIYAVWRGERETETA